MKIFLIIIFSIIALVVFLLFSKIKFTFRYDGNIRFEIAFFFLKFDFAFPVLYKDKNNENDEISEFLTEAQKKDTQNDKKTNVAESNSSRTKKTEKDSNKTEKDSNKNKKKEKPPFPGIKNVILYFKDIVFSLFGTIIHSFRLEELTFMGVAASDNAASTATLYGHMCTAAAAIHQFASNAKGMNDNKVYIEITPDFLAQSSDFYANIKFSIRIFRILFILKKVLSAWNGYKDMAIRVEKEKNSNKKISE